MSDSYRRRRSRTAPEGAQYLSTWSLPLAAGSYEEQEQLAEHDGVGNDEGERYQRSGNERCHRPVLRDHRVQTCDASHSTRAIEWTVTSNPSGIEDSQQVTQIEGTEDEYDGDDETNGNYNENDYYRRRDCRRSTRPPEQSSYYDPPIANFVRSQAQRRSSHGRALFSPSSLQNGETAMTRYGAIEFPLLPISNQRSTSSLSQAALNFANISSGDFRLCVIFLRDHESLLREDYHSYLQEAWKALWDEEKVYAHQCLSRWFLLDECRQIWPRDIGKHINQRTFSGKKFLDGVDDVYKALKTLRQDVLREMGLTASGGAGDAGGGMSHWSIKGIGGFLQGVDRAKVLRNVENVCRLVTDVRRELKGRKQEFEMQTRQ
jgi:hypothetical protein